METVAIALALIAGACLAFLLYCLAENRGYLRRRRRRG